MPGTSEGTPNTLHLQLLGPPAWHRPGGTTQPLAARDAAWLAVLALDGAQPRERIGAWLWPQASTRQVGDSLRQRLFQLRRSTGHAVVESGPMLRLADGVTVDLQVDPLLAEGSLLAGCDLGPLEELQAWLQAARDRIAIRQTQAWAGEAAQCETRGDLAAAVALCERIVAMRPATEHAWRRLMRLHWLQGDRAAAVGAFERFEQQVCREHGLRPSAETLTLLETVERADPQASADPGAAHALPPALLRPPRLVGRDQPLAAARAAWAAGRPVLLLADGGLGKSRLLEALLESPALMTRARPGDADQPYSTLTTWLSQALDRFAPPLPGPVRGELARLLPALGPAPEGEADQRRLWQAVESALAGCVAQGLRSWALDDLHLADAASLELLRWLLGSERLGGLYGAFAARPPAAGPSGLSTRSTADVASALGDTQRLERLWLDPLTPAQVGDLLQSLALPDWSDLTATRLQTLYRHTGGQPFLLLETLKSLVIAGESSAQGAGDGPLPLPPAVDALIGQRLAGLPPTALALMQVLSVAGGQLRLAVAARALQQPLPSMAEAWSVLAAAQLVQTSGDVAHDLVRECVLRALPAATRQAWHLALATAMADEPGVEPAVAASHWQAAQQWPRAALAWRQAAAAASRAGRLGEWETLLLQAAAAHREAGETDAALDDHIDALTARSLKAGPAAVAGDLTRLLAEGHHGEARARLLMLQGTLAFNQMRLGEVMQLASAALDQASEGTRTHQQARLMHGRAAAMSGQHQQALASLREACDAAQALAQPEPQLEALGTLAHALHGARQRAEAVACQRRALQVARRHSGRFHQAECAANLAVLLLTAGEVDAVVDAADEALAGFAAMAINDAPSAVMALSMRARAWAHQGRLASAVHSLEPLAQPGTAGLAGAMARTGLAQLLLWLGWPRKALAVLDGDDALAPLNLRVQAALVRAAAGAPGAVATLQSLGAAQPALRDDGLVYREWSRWDPPAQAAERLDRLAAAELAAGAPATARSLRVRAVACRRALDAQRAASEARALMEELEAVTAPQTGLHAGTNPPEVWKTLALALQPVHPRLAARAAARAKAWVGAAELPPGARRDALMRSPAAAPRTPPTAPR
jgi:DNA-binding SARP family transcriptional activator